LRTENANFVTKEIVGVVRLRTPIEADDLFEETLAAQTIQKAAQPSRANHFERRFPWEVAQTLLPKAGSLQRHQAKDCQVFRLMHDLQLPTKEETA
jgi:hypothetical protein